MDEKTLVIVGTLLAIILGVIAPLVAWFCGGKELQGDSKEAIRQMFNWGITFAIVFTIVMMIPLIGQLIGFVLMVLNIVYAIRAFNFATKGGSLNIPAIDFIK